jgi:hypothetical protein
MLSTDPENVHAILRRVPINLQTCVAKLEDWYSRLLWWISPMDQFWELCAGFVSGWVFSDAVQSSFIY